MCVIHTNYMAFPLGMMTKGGGDKYRHNN